MVACTVILLLIGFIWIGSANQGAKWAVSAFVSPPPQWVPGVCGADHRMFADDHLQLCLPNQHVRLHYLVFVGFRRSSPRPKMNSGPLGYVIFAEVSSAKLRSKTVGIGIWTNSLCGMVANIVIPYL